MPDTQWKRAIPARVRKPGDPRRVSWPSELKKTPFGLALESQDTIFNGCRILASQHTGGSAEWLVDNTGTGGASQVYPSPTTWRTAARVRATLAPGQALDFRMLSVPSGPSEYFVAASSTWELYGNVAKARVVIEYDNGSDTDTVIVERTLPGSTEDDAIEDQTAGSAWANLQHHFVGSVRPADVTLAGVAKWSEWPTVTMIFDHKGGARVLCMSITEVPIEHVVADTVTDASTLHDFTDDQQAGLPTLWPQTKIADGATYQDNRYGTHHGLFVANRQTQRMGPKIADWSSYAELVDVTVIGSASVSSNSASPFVGLAIGSGITAWAATNPGFDMPGAYCAPAPYNLATRMAGNACSIPVRIRCYMRCTTAGAGSVYLKLQSSPRSAVTLTMPRVDTFDWYTITGYLEGNVTQADHYAILQDFVKVSGAFTAEFRYWSLEWGAFAVAA